MKQPFLSAEKYIQTKARSLPVYKCYITGDWEEVKIANVLVMRKHTNGNITVGFYLVDLLCLGIKDSFYFFNETEEEINERIEPMAPMLIETDYNTAHNIVYAGHDFAMDFDIPPHKNFGVSKFILEEDDDHIPLIEIPVGNDEGKPHLMVNASYPYAAVLNKLKLHAGEGNYEFTLADDDFDEDDEFDDEENDWDEDEFDEDDPDGDNNNLSEIDEGFLDFNLLRKQSKAEILHAMQYDIRSGLDLIIMKTELLFRQLAEAEPENIPATEDIVATEPYKKFADKAEQSQEAMELNAENAEYIFNELKDILADGGFTKDAENGMMELLQKNIFNEQNSFMVLQTMPIHIILPLFNELQKNFHRYLPAVQLLIAAYAVLQRKGLLTNYQFILNAESIDKAYPDNDKIHALHHKQFWLVKAFHALAENDTEKIIFYHSLLRVSGIGGNIKYLYAAQLTGWLAKYLDIYDDDDLMEEEE